MSFNNIFFWIQDLKGKQINWFNKDKLYNLINIQSCFHRSMVWSSSILPRSFELTIFSIKPCEQPKPSKTSP